jgi:hypothetical protein
MGGGAYRVLVGNTERKRLHRRPRRRWEGNIKMVRKVMGWEGVTWIRLRIGKRYGYCGNHNENLGYIKCGSFLNCLRNL